MATEKMVKCYVRHDDPPDSAASPRFVPLDIFDLWKFLMEERHRFRVSDPKASLWFERGAATASSYAGIEHEPVTQVELFYFAEEDGVLHQEVRYFPSGDGEAYDRIKSAFVAHYRNHKVQGRGDPKLNETPGVYIKRQFVGGDPRDESRSNRPLRSHHSALEDKDRTETGFQD